MATQSSSSEDNLFGFLLNKYLPFWPLFAGLLVLALAGAWAYLHFLAVPLYEASATIIVKDTKKGVEESRMTRSMDAFIANNIVENEIKVMQSRASVMQVVKALGLYAPMYEEGPYRSLPAYTSSPVRITLQTPEKAQAAEKVYFSYEPTRRQVKLGNKWYPLGQWVQTPYGVLRFSRNERKNKPAAGPLYFSLQPFKLATNSLSARLSIQTENKLSTAVSLRLKDAVPERAEDILNHLIEAYTQVGITNRNKLAASTLEFVENRLRVVGKELEELEKQVVDYKSSQGVVDLSEQGKVFLNNVGENERQLTDMNLQLAMLERVGTYLASKTPTESMSLSTLGIKDPALAQLIEQLSASEIEYQKLRKITAENNPILLSLTDEIKRIRQNIRDNVSNQLQALKTSRAKLLAAQDQYNTVLQTLPQKERDLLDINRQQTSKSESYRFLLQKREEALLSLAPSTEETSFIDLAEASLTPVSPQPLYLYFIAMLAACGLGVALVSGKELLTDKVLFRSEIEQHTRIPIVGELSYLPQQPGQLFCAPSAAFVTEQFRQLRVTLGLYGRFFVKRKIVVTSNIPGEGKSFVSSHLAYSLAASGKKVALVDFDLRNPRTSGLFERPSERGITEYLLADSGLEQVIYPTPVANLFLVPAGLQVGDNTELLLNGKLESFFAYLENEFDYLIIDTPPVELVSDAYLLAEFCDTTLLVLRHGHTPKRLVQRLDQNLKLKALPHLALVFNGVKSRGFVKKHHGYGYGYGHENKYGVKAYMAGQVKTETKAS